MGIFELLAKIATVLDEDEAIALVNWIDEAEDWMLVKILDNWISGLLSR